MIGVYCIINLKTHRIYIGESANIEQRWKTHKDKLKRGTHPNKYLQNDWNKYGKDSFSFEILEECEPEDLIEKEDYWLKKFGDADSKDNYNLKFSKSLRLCKESCEQIKATLKGTHPKTEWKKGVDTYWTKKPVEQYDLEGNFIKRFNSAKEASLEVGCSIGNITCCCRGEIKKAKNFQWKYENDNKIIGKYKKNTTLGKKYPERSGKNNHKSKSVMQFDLDGNFIKEWESINLASKVIKIDGRTIGNNCRKKIKSAGGFQWKFSYDSTPMQKYKNNASKKISQYDLEGNFIRTFNSIREAASYVRSIKKGSGKYIGHCISGRIKATNGFIWKKE